MGLFKRHRQSADDADHPATASPAHADEDAVVEVAVLEQWRAELAVEALRNDGIRAATLEAHGRRRSWSCEPSVELLTHDQRALGVSTARILVHRSDAARALKLLCELREC